MSEFYDEGRLEAAQQQRSPVGAIAYIPGENAPLSGLGQVNRDLPREVGQKIAMADPDVTMIETRKQEALRTYRGRRGYQPSSQCGR